MKIFLDTATSDFWEWKVSSQDKRYAAAQPHLVGLSAVNDRDISCCSRITPPDGVVISPGAAEYHGITNEMVKDGRLLAEVLEADGWVERLNGASLIVAHNAAYHRRVLELSFKRAGFALSGSVPWFCTREMSAPIVQVERQKNGGWKRPTLEEAASFFEPGRALAKMDSEHPLANTEIEPWVAVQRIYEGITGRGG